jgi:lipopolysaccharide export system permease protein
MKIFFLYILRELFLHTALFFTFFLVLLTLIMGTLNLKSILDLNPDFIFIVQFYFFTSFQLFSFLFPLSSFLSILFTFQRLKEERELLALFSLGYTLQDFFKPFFIYTIVLFLAVFFSQIYLTPKAKRIIKEAQIELARNLLESSIRPKTPISLTQNLYLYVSEAEEKNSTYYLRRVILLERRDLTHQGTYLAKEALLDLKNGFFLLKDGFCFIHSKYRDTEILKFKEYSFNISRESFKKPDLYIKRGEMSLSELKEEIKKAKPQSERYYRYLSEYYHRIVYAFSVFPLLFQALMLSFIFKPQSRFLLFLIGLSFYLLFYFLYNFFVSLGENGKLFPLYSHLFFNGLLLLLLFFEVALLRKRGLNFL